MLAPTIIYGHEPIWFLALRFSAASIIFFTYHRYSDYVAYRTIFFARRRSPPAAGASSYFIFPKLTNVGSGLYLIARSKVWAIVSTEKGEG